MRQPFFPPEPAKKPFVCPVCKGRGAEISAFLYMANIIECYACKGTGIVWG